MILDLLYLCFPDPRLAELRLRLHRTGLQLSSAQAELAQQQQRAGELHRDLEAEKARAAALERERERISALRTAALERAAAAEEALGLAQRDLAGAQRELTTARAVAAQEVARVNLLVEVLRPLRLLTGVTGPDAAPDTYRRAIEALGLLS